MPPSHNLGCLLQSAYELGITATFWDNAPVDEAPDCLDTESDADPYVESLAWV